jgi:hypothetical protein
VSVSGSGAASRPTPCRASSTSSTNPTAQSRVPASAWPWRGGTEAHGGHLEVESSVGRARDSPSASQRGRWRCERRSPRPAAAGPRGTAPRVGRGRRPGRAASRI